MSSKNAVEEFRVVIFFDRIASVGPAMVAYSHLIRELEGSFSTELRLWRTDVASSPEGSAEANGDIESARMVIMAFRRPQPVPGEFWEWSSGEGVGYSRSLVAAVLGTATTPHPSRGIWKHLLRGASKQIQMDIFLWIPELPASSADIERQTDGIAPGKKPPAGAQKLESSPPFKRPASLGSRTSYSEMRQPIESGVRGAQLFRVTRPEDLSCYWETEMTLGSNSINRRFASELHARAWLASSDYLVPEPSSLDLEELNGRFRCPNLVQ
jgi:hypothetical protein